MVGSSNLNEQDKMEVSKEWELIETTLRDDQFWSMFNAKGLNDTATRIDLLFALVLSAYYGQKKSKKEFKLEDVKANPRIIFERFDEKNINLKKLWDEILRCFWWMQSCYSDTELFNYLGWIREFTEISAKSIYNSWLEHQKIEDFKNCVKAIVREQFKNKRFEDIHYEAMQTVDLRKFFVLFNIFDCNNTDERFRFDLYSKGEWDIEHIDSQTPNQLKYDTEKRSWLYYAYKELDSDVIHKQEGDLWAKIIEEYDSVLDNEHKEKESELDTFISEKISLEQFEEKAQKILSLLPKATEDNIPNEHLVGNLALLNMSINRSYKNAIFPAKRKIIRNYINSGKCYIPPCTRKTFMKFYTNSPSKILCWTNSDYNDYSNVLKNWYETFMNMPETANCIKSDTDKQTYKLAINPTEINNLNKTNGIPDATNYYDKHNHNSINEECNFLDFIQKYNIIIPKIQRLYVQGRQDKKGYECLNGFATTLVKSVVNSEICILDLVYGIKSDKGLDFYPLDGQQRLTTLLLLSWLCNHLNCGNNKENHNKKKFSYQSRRSNEFFIEKLLETPPSTLLTFQKPEDYDKSIRDPKLKGKYYLPTCSESIKQSDWFLPIWEKDPGISGMLEMLDSLYDKILNIGAEKLNSLRNSNSKIEDAFDFSIIRFYVTYLNTNEKSYDHVFLKMNSRGKELSTWDNVKAILDLTAPAPTANSDWSKDVQIWYENMWDLYAKNNDSPNIEDVDNKMNDIVNLTLKCFGFKDGADQTFALASWLEDKSKEDSKTIANFYKTCGHFFNCLFDEHNINTFPKWAKQCAFDVKSNAIVINFYRPLLAFYAQKLSDNKKWLRFCLNMIENTVDQESSFISLFKLLCKIYEAKDFDGGDGIYNVLIREVFEYPSEQLKEEIAKAKQILNPIEDSILPSKTESWNPSKEWNWETAIIEAENSAFFKGAIRFLFSDAEGNMNDWHNFGTKLNNCNKYFDETGVESSYSKDAILLRRLLCYFDRWELWWKIAFGHSSVTWRSILLNPKLHSQIHQLLIKDDSKSFDFSTYVSPYIHDNAAKIKFLTEMLIRKSVLSVLPNDLRLVWRGNWDVDGVYDLDNRNSGSHPYYIIHPRLLLLTDDELQITNCKRNKDNPLFIYGVPNIRFEYNGKLYEWCITERKDQDYNVYLWDKTTNTYSNKKNLGVSPEDKGYYYGINIDGNISQDSFKNKLRELANEYDKDNPKAEEFALS